MCFPASPRRELALETISEMIKRHFDSLQEVNEKQLVTPGKKTWSTNGKVSSARKVSPCRKNILISKHIQGEVKKLKIEASQWVKIPGFQSYRHSTSKMATCMVFQWKTCEKWWVYKIKTKQQNTLLWRIWRKREGVQVLLTKQGAVPDASSVTDSLYKREKDVNTSSITFRTLGLLAKSFEIYLPGGSRTGRTLLVLESEALLKDSSHAFVQGASAPVLTTAMEGLQGWPLWGVAVAAWCRTRMVPAGSSAGHSWSPQPRRWHLEE